MLDPPTAGVAGTPPFLVTHLTISAGQEVNASFPVTVSADLPGSTVITNTASVTSTGVGAPVWGMRTVVVTPGSPERVYLPLVLGLSP